MVKAKFKFHPVGQGAFYTGKVFENKRKDSIIKGKEFNIVYDCGVSGSPKYLTKAIKVYKDELRDEKLNVLILSHLDSDHVNGVTKLLNGITCENIYMPYLTPFERLMLAFLHESEDEGDTSYYDFIKNPHDYLSKISPDTKIIYVLGNIEEDFVIEDSITVQERNEVTINFGKIEDNLEINNKVRNTIELVEETLDERIKFKKGNKSIKLGDIWDFYLYHSLHDNAPEIERSKLRDELIQEIKIMCKITIIEKLTQVQLCEILDNKKFSDLKLEFFAKNYININKKLRQEKRSKFINESSLMVLHRPLSHKKGEIKKKKGLPPFYSYPKKQDLLTIKKRNDNTSKNYGLTLLTGDIGLEQINNSQYIKNELEKIDIIQVPHHGSNTGWDNGGNLSQLNTDKSISAIINFGYGNNYGHPRENILQDLMGKNFDIRFATQFEEFSYEFNLNYW